MKLVQLKRIFSAVLVIGIGAVAVFFLSDFLEKNRAALPAGYEDEDLAVQGAKLKGWSFGAEGLLADWYWMKSLQYIGDKVIKSDRPVSLDNMRELNPRLLYPYLDNATTLDPRFTSAYEYGAMVLPAIDPAQAIKLLEKGIAENPNNWRLYHNLGYIYWQLKNYEKASEYYEAGSKIADAPDWMRLMAGKTKADGGSRATARELYRQIFDESQDAQTKENARLRLEQIDSLDELEAIQKALQDFRTKTGNCAQNWQQILPLLGLVKLPNGLEFRLDSSNNVVDPSGTPYLLDKTKCEVSIDRARSKVLTQ